ncbi:MAG: hypothetical protein WC770_03955 [Phycisphaerae bacterium]|jgi:hypothetical protein
MDQKLLNTIALDAIERHRTEVFRELRDLLEEDCKKRQGHIPGEAIHHVHNVVLFDCLVLLNPFFSRENDSENAWREYLRFADTLEPKFREIVNNLKDFRPASNPQEDKKKDKLKD